MSDSHIVTSGCHQTTAADTGRARARGGTARRRAPGSLLAMSRNDLVGNLVLGPHSPRGALQQQFSRPALAGAQSARVHASPRRPGTVHPSSARGAPAGDGKEWYPKGHRLAGTRHAVAPPTSPRVNPARPAVGKAFTTVMLPAVSPRTSRRAPQPNLYHSRFDQSSDTTGEAAAVVATQLQSQSSTQSSTSSHGSHPASIHLTAARAARATQAPAASQGGCLISSANGPGDTQIEATSDTLLDELTISQAARRADEKYAQREEHQQSQVALMAYRAIPPASNHDCG